MSNWIFVLEMIGTVAFAISGALVAIKKNMDMLGIAILGMTTAVGGGIIRDLILGITPPMAFQSPIYAIVAIIVSLICFIPFVRKLMEKLPYILLVFDSIGLGIFTVVGVEAGIKTGNIFLTVFVGTVTGVGGGVMRDLFAGEKPQIFVRHFYATASIVGSLVAALTWSYSQLLAVILGTSVIIVLRILAAIFKWNLPKPRKEEKDS